MPRLAEVEPAGQLTHDAQVGPRDPLRLERPGVFQARPQAGRPQVRVHAHRLAQCQQRGFGLEMSRRGVERRIADGAEEHGVGRQARLESRLGQGRAGRARRRAADGPGRRVESLAEDVADSAEHRQRPLDHFGPDAVTGQNCDTTRHALPLYTPSRVWRPRAASARQGQAEACHHIGPRRGLHSVPVPTSGAIG